MVLESPPIRCPLLKLGHSDSMAAAVSALPVNTPAVSTARKLAATVNRMQVVSECIQDDGRRPPSDVKTGSCCRSNLIIAPDPRTATANQKNDRPNDNHKSRWRRSGFRKNQRKRRTWRRIRQLPYLFPCCKFVTLANSSRSLLGRKLQAR